MPKESLRTFAIGATQFVVHEAFDKTLCDAGSYWSSFTPSTSVMSSPVAGAEMMTFFAPPRRWPAALSLSVKIPVDSTTISTPSPAHGRSAGFRSEKTLTVRPSISRSAPLGVTSPG